MDVFGIAALSMEVSRVQMIGIGRRSFVVMSNVIELLTLRCTGQGGQLFASGSMK